MGQSPGRNNLSSQSHNKMPQKFHTPFPPPTPDAALSTLHSGEINLQPIKKQQQQKVEIGKNGQSLRSLQALKIK